MSAEVLHEVITRALDDNNFFKHLVRYPNQVLSGYDLTEDERQALCHLNINHLAQLNWALDERRSKSPWTLTELRTLLGL